eukprot:CAMPEP_0197246168 /NCGR_PEP_ID=MMETSP1429-20130617/10711_1 /TAXON_ID=49237 /ORGANISM="Chaetoceros  sp., Strain UNC1202" /LENGTH=71 /DNA_ID=CAMNT_0042706779 /DNA_START=48 /DNA_END=260 /DNA_ORIENTATION=+
MVLALKELSIRGDISTTVDCISKLIELDDFVNNDIGTCQLDRLIKQKRQWNWRISPVLNSQACQEMFMLSS